MASVKKITPTPPPEYVITLTEDEARHLVQALDCTTYGIAINLSRKLTELGIPK